MPNYLLALRDDPSMFQDVSPEQMQEIIARYQAWSEANHAALVSGHKLADGEGRVVRKRGGKTDVSDGPFSESKEMLGGFYVIRADSYDKAVAMLDGHPHVEFGSIEVRAIDPMGEADGDA